MSASVKKIRAMRCFRAASVALRMRARPMCARTSPTSMPTGCSTTQNRVGGVVVGALVGLLSRWLLPRLALPASGLYPVAIIALLMLAYGLAALLHTSGFAAVYVVALIMAASPLPHRRAVLGFIEGLAWAVQIGLFVMLGLLAVPSRLGEAVGIAMLVGGLLLVVARPLSVLVSLGGFMRSGWLTRVTRTAPMPWQWVAFTSWAGLRGAVPIIFATIPLSSGHSDGPLIFDVTLLLVILLTVLQAPTMPILGHRLGLVRTEQVRELTVEVAPLDSIRAAILHLEIHAGSRVAGTYVSELPLPAGAVVSLVIRGDETLAPDRSTRIKAGDRLLLVTTVQAREATEKALESVSRGGRLAGWNRARRRSEESRESVDPRASSRRKGLPRTPWSANLARYFRSIGPLVGARDRRSGREVGRGWRAARRPGIDHRREVVEGLPGSGVRGAASGAADQVGHDLGGHPDRGSPPPGWAEPPTRNRPGTDEALPGAGRPPAHRWTRSRDGPSRGAGGALEVRGGTQLAPQDPPRSGRCLGRPGGR